MKTINMTRIDIINHLIEKFGYSKFLEIGTQNGESLRGVKLDVKNKVGVDPDPHSRATIYMTSDEYFEAYPELKYPIIFIDGLHHSDQVFTDVVNALNVLESNGTIVMHDCLPPNEESQIVPRQTKIWTGDCWKAFVKFRQREDLEMYTVDTDFGCGIIRKGVNKNPLTKEVTDYKEFDDNRKELMNIISTDEFLNIF